MPDTRVIAADGLGVAEVHAHTRASDGMVTAPELVRAAAAIGLSVVCVTDHDTIPPIAEALDVGRELGVDVVAGEEVTTAFPPGIHVIGLFLDHPIRMHMSVEDTVGAIHDQGALAILPHPFMPTWFASITPRRARALLERQPVDGIEARHTAPLIPGTWSVLDRFVAEHGARVGARLGAGDSHFGRHDLGRALTVFPGRTAADFRNAILQRTTSPLLGAVRPHGPGLGMRLGQQYRAVVWLSMERRAGRVGGGAGPSG